MFLRKELVDISNYDVDSERSGTSLDDGYSLRKDTSVDEESLALLAEVAESHNHSLGGSGTFVEERSVGNVESGERCGECLEVDE